MQTGAATLFPSEAVPVPAVLCDLDAVRGCFPCMTPEQPLIMLDVTSFAGLLNDSANEFRPKLDPLDYTETLVSLLYRMIEVSPLRRPVCGGGGLESDITNMALLAFMTTLLPDYCRGQSSCPLLSARLERAVEDLGIDSAEYPDGEISLLLWALFISGISVLKSRDCRRLPGLILNLCRRLGLYGWPAIHRHLCQYPWVHALHNAPGRSLWDEAQRASSQIS